MLPGGKSVMRRCLPAPLVIGVLLFGALAAAQTYPGQYPNQYPPGQYPPGQYPPGQYPNTYPARLPGGVPIGLPVPEIKLPKKKNDKNGSAGSSHDEEKTTVATADGSLRKLGEKDLLLQTGRKAVLRFRLLAKTQFRNKAGEPIRDSLLHAGDQLSVEVSPDDVETALRVILMRSGTAADRAAAEQPVEEAAVRVPRPEDFSKPHTVTTRAAAAGDSDAAPAPDSATSPDLASVPGLPRDSHLDTDEQIIRDARAAATAFSASLPNFLVQ